MNILIFSWRDIKHPLAGGAEQVINEHAKGWIASGHQVTHFSSRFKGSKEKEIIDRVEIIRRGYQYYLGVQFAGFLYYLKNRENFDLVIDEFHGMPFFTPLFVRKQKIAVVQETARKVWFLNPLPWPLNWLIGLIGYIIEPFVFLFYKETPFITGSLSAKKDVIKMGISPSKITVIPHGVIIPRITVLPKKERKRTVIFLGKLSKDKGIEHALRCFSILDKEGIWQFWVVGDYETKGYFNELKKKVHNMHFKNKINFWGFVPQTKKFELLAKAHILVNPSVHEGWGLVNIEANSVGTPVVSYKSMGLIDSVKNNISGLICNENTPDNLAKNILALMRDEGTYTKFQKGAKNWSRKFSWELSRKYSLKLLHKVVDQN